jgi:hypothetical protein
MRKKALPIGVLFMVLVVLLAAVAVSYGYWTETIGADGTLSTGNLNVYWYPMSASVGGTPGSASCSATAPDEDTLDVVLTDMHPGATCTVITRIYNNGTVPVEITLGDANHTGGYDMDAWLDIPSAGCDGGGIIAPSSYITCSATFEMLWDAPNSTQNRTTYYSADVLAEQYAP